MRCIIIIAFVFNTTYAQYPILVNGHTFSSNPTLADDTIAVAMNSGGGTAYGGTNWNNLTVANSTSSTTSSLVWLDNGTNSGASVTISNSSIIQDNGSGTCPSPTDGFPSQVHRYSSQYGASSRTLTFNSLPAGNYRMIMLCSRSGSSAQTRWVVTAASVQSNDLAAGDGTNPNCSNVATNASTVSPSSGTITFNINRVAGTGFQFINSVYLIKDNTP